MEKDQGRRDEAKKVKHTKSGDGQHDPLVGCLVQHEEMVTKRPVVKKYNYIQKTPKSPEFVKMDSEDSENNEEDEPGVKNALKSQEFVKDRPRGLWGLRT